MYLSAVHTLRVECLSETLEGSFRLGGVVVSWSLGTPDSE